MTKKISIKQIIDMWPERRILAQDIAEFIGQSFDVHNVHKWHRRNSIDGKYDAAILHSAQKRNIRLTAIDIVNARSIHTDQLGHNATEFQGDAA